jgi:hypothetical protein
MPVPMLVRAIAVFPVLLLLNDFDFSIIVAVSFIGRENQITLRKPPTCCKLGQ